MHLLSLSAIETCRHGASLGARLPPNSVLCFFGDLGAGKTTFIKGLVSAVTKCSIEEVSSPTFTYLNIYGLSPAVYHFDLYRLKDVEEFLSMGFDEYLYADGICCIEWSERIADIVPENAFRVSIKHAGGTKRDIEITGDTKV